MNKKYTKQELLQIYENWDILPYNQKMEIYKYNPKLFHINEMAFNRGRFIGLCGNISEQITYNLIYIIILGSFDLFYEYVNHWKTELMSYIIRLYKCDVEKSVKKDKIIYEYIIDTYVDNITWEFDNIVVAEDALKEEIKKGYRNPMYKNEVNFIKNNILPNIDTIIDNHKHEFAQLYKLLIKSFKDKDINIFKTALTNF